MIRTRRKNMTLLFLLFMSIIFMGIGYASTNSITGASDTFSKQGIYDLAGNVSEWTLETKGTDYFINRGGIFYGPGDLLVTIYRMGNTITYYVESVGFRVSIFLFVLSTN